MVNIVPIVPRASLSAAFCRFLTWAVWSVTPLSWAYLTFSLVGPHLDFDSLLPWHLAPFLSRATPPPLPLHRFLLAYTTSEALFSLYYRYLTRSVQRRRPSPLYSRAFLLEIFRRSLGNGLEEAVTSSGTSTSLKDAAATLDVPPLRKRSRKDGRDALDEDFPLLSFDDPRAADFRQMQLGWFRGVPFEKIQRENVLEWLSWACYGMRWDEVRAEAEGHPLAGAASSSEGGELDDPEESSGQSHLGIDVGPTKLDFLSYLLGLLERRGGTQFPEGYNADIKPVLLTLDPARVQSRPLILYVVVWLLGAWTKSIALRHGFVRTQHRLPHGRRFNYLVRIPKGWTAEGSKQAEDGSRDNRPLLFLHGLGMGLAQYASFVSHLSTSPAFAHRPIIILEQPHISMSFFSRGHLRPPSPKSTIMAIRAIVERWKLGGDGLTVLSHSNGTIVHAWLMKAAPEMVKRSCFVDPVTFCLFEPPVAYNFLYRTPKAGIEILMRYFVGSELGVAHMLHRHFNWAENILWARHDAHLHDPKQTFIFLAEKDSILSAPRIRKYLRANGVLDAEEGGNLVMEKGAAHGETMVAGGAALQRVERFLRGMPVGLSSDTTPIPSDTEARS